MVRLPDAPCAVATVLPAASYMVTVTVTPDVVLTSTHVVYDTLATLGADSIVLPSSYDRLTVANDRSRSHAMDDVVYNVTDRSIPA